VIESYDRIDYSKFNLGFREKYLYYETFLRDRGIIQNLNRNNEYLYLTDTKRFDEYRPNIDSFRELAEKVTRHRILYGTIDILREIRNRC